MSKLLQKCSMNGINRVLWFKFKWDYKKFKHNLMDCYSLCRRNKTLQLRLTNTLLLFPRIYKYWKNNYIGTGTRYFNLLVKWIITNTIPSTVEILMRLPVGSWRYGSNYEIQELVIQSEQLQQRLICRLGMI